MSKYTTELRFICETEAGLSESKGYNDVASIIESARPHIFNFSYPIFDNTYKPGLEAKILKHFYTREIGYETYGLWKLKLDAKLNEIMPYYNKMYESELIEFNPLYDTDLHREGSRDESVNTTKSESTTGNSTNSGTDTTTGVSRDSGTDTRNTADRHNEWDLYSDTPQGGVNGIAAAEDDPALGTNAYLTNARHTFGDTNGSTGSTTYGKTTNQNGSTAYGKVTNTTGSLSGTGSSTGDVDYAEHVWGYSGRNPSRSIKEFRDILLNIDMMVIEELEELFLQLW